jgi:hypothetical protein
MRFRILDMIANLILLAFGYNVREGGSKELNSL